MKCLRVECRLMRTIPDATLKLIPILLVIVPKSKFGGIGGAGSVLNTKSGARCHTQCEVCSYIGLDNPSPFSFPRRRIFLWAEQAPE